MSLSFSAAFGFTAFFLRSINISSYLGYYYFTLKKSISEYNEINLNNLYTLSHIIFKILYAIYILIYAVANGSDFYLTTTAVVYGVIFFLFLNMQLYIQKQKSTMFIKTLIISAAGYSSHMFVHKIMNYFLLIIFAFLSNFYDYDKYRRALISKDHELIEIEITILDIIACFMWVVYSLCNDFALIVFVQLSIMSLYLLGFFTYLLLTDSLNKKYKCLLNAIFYILLRKSLTEVEMEEQMDAIKLKNINNAANNL